MAIYPTRISLASTRFQLICPFRQTSPLQSQGPNRRHRLQQFLYCGIRISVVTVRDLVAVETFLQSHCLLMDVFSSSAIPAFSKYVTI